MVSWKRRESCPVVGRNLWSACMGWQPPTALAHWLGGRGVLPSRWLLLKERLKEDGSPRRRVSTD